LEKKIVTKIRELKEDKRRRDEKIKLFKNVAITNN
jgi:hypothetical protein